MSTNLPSHSIQMQQLVRHHHYYDATTVIYDRLRLYICNIWYLTAQPHRVIYTHSHCTQISLQTSLQTLFLSSTLSFLRCQAVRLLSAVIFANCRCEIVLSASLTILKSKWETGQSSHRLLVSVMPLNNHLTAPLIHKFRFLWNYQVNRDAVKVTFVDCFLWCFSHFISLALWIIFNVFVCFWLRWHFSRLDLEMLVGFHCLFVHKIRVKRKLWLSTFPFGFHERHKNILVWSYDVSDDKIYIFDNWMKLIFFGYIWTRSLQEKKSHLQHLQASIWVTKDQILSN